MLNKTCSNLRQALTYSRTKGAVFECEEDRELALAGSRRASQQRGLAIILQMVVLVCANAEIGSRGSRGTQHSRQMNVHMSCG